MTFRLKASRVTLPVNEKKTEASNKTFGAFLGFALVAVAGFRGPLERIDEGVECVFGFARTESKVRASFEQKRSSVGSMDGDFEKPTKLGHGEMGSGSNISISSEEGSLRRVGPPLGRGSVKNSGKFAGNQNGVYKSLKKRTSVRGHFKRDN